MKKILTLVLLTISSRAISQITLEHTYNNSDQIRLINLSLSGDKYTILDKTNNELRLYNANHSLWKTINIPQYTGYELNFVEWVSEELFDTDNLVEIEVGYLSTNQPAADKIEIINEAGTVLNTFTDVYGGFVMPDNSDNFKLFIYDNSNNTSKVYSLPGTLPCGMCGGLGLNKLPKVNSAHLSGPIPNPSSDQVTIHYELPTDVKNAEIELFNSTGQSIKTYRVDNSFNSIILNNRDLSPGSYYYLLKGSGIQSASKKLIVIR